MKPWLRSWAVFLFSTPKRCLWTLGVLCAIALVVEPKNGELLVGRILAAFNPVIQLLVFFAVLAVGYRFLFKKSAPPKKGK